MRQIDLEDGSWLTATRHDCRASGGFKQFDGSIVILSINRLICCLISLESCPHPAPSTLLRSAARENRSSSAP